MSFCILQYAGDTIKLRDRSWSKLCSIKMTLQRFEFVLGLRINFFKCKMYGVNLEEHFLRVTSSFLSHRTKNILFKFLGVLVKAYLKRCCTWNLVVDAMRRWMSTWKRKQLSIWGRLTLINLVLSNLPLHFLSSFRLLVTFLASELIQSK